MLKWSLVDLSPSLRCVSFSFQGIPFPTMVHPEVSFTISHGTPMLARFTLVMFSSLIHNFVSSIVFIHLPLYHPPPSPFLCLQLVAIIGYIKPSENWIVLLRKSYVLTNAAASVGVRVWNVHYRELKKYASEKQRARECPY